MFQICKAGQPIIIIQQPICSGLFRIEFGRIITLIIVDFGRKLGA
jgi:hypothetical protein